MMILKMMMTKHDQTCKGFPRIMYTYTHYSNHSYKQFGKGIAINHPYEGYLSVHTKVKISLTAEPIYSEVSH